MFCFLADFVEQTRAQDEETERNKRIRETFKHGAFEDIVKRHADKVMSTNIICEMSCGLYVYCITRAMYIVRVPNENSCEFYDLNEYAVLINFFLYAPFWSQNSNQSTKI